MSASAAGSPPSRLVPTNPAYFSSCKGGILLNRLPPSAAIPATGTAKVKETLKAVFTGTSGSSAWREEVAAASSKRPGSPASFSTASSKAESSRRSSDGGSTSPKISFAPLPASGRTRASSITVGVAARAAMLANQRGAKAPAPKPQPAPVPVPPPEPQFSGSGEQGLYTVKDVGKGLSKGWSKLRGRSASRESREAASASGATTPKAPAEARKGALADVTEEPDGGKTPRRSSLTPVHSRAPVDEEETAPVRRAASMGPPSGHADPHAQAAHDRAVFGYDPAAIRDALLGAVGLGGATDADEPARGRNADVVGTNSTPVQSRRSSPKRGEERFEREVWRGAARTREESSSSGGDEDSAPEDEGFESAGEDTTDDDEAADLEHARSTAAAGIELFDRHR